MVPLRTGAVRSLVPNGSYQLGAAGDGTAHTSYIPYNRRVPDRPPLPEPPSDVETAERAVADTRAMTPHERIELFRWILAGMDDILAGREPFRFEDDPPFWQRWKDHSFGRPA